MRTPLALAVYVSFAAVSFAQTPLNMNEVNTSVNQAWIIAHDAGLAAFDNQNFEKARDEFDHSWTVARTPEEQGASAHDRGRMLRKLDVRAKPGNGWSARMMSGATI